MSRSWKILTILSVGAGGSYLLFRRQIETRPSLWKTATVVSTEPSGPNTKIITVSTPKSLPRILPPIWSVFIKDDDIQVERPYTPLFTDRDQLVFWIKSYPTGEVGRWLHSKHVGDQFEFRGPLQTWPWAEDTAWDDIVMISGGTGITPFFQLFNSVISKKQSTTKFTLIHCSRHPSELPPPLILDPLASYAETYPNEFRFHVFVDSPGDPSPSMRPSIKLQVGLLTTELLARCLGHTSTLPWWQRAWTTGKMEQRKVLFLVCGPEGMIASVAGPYGKNFAQGPIGGILKELGYTSKQVVKL